MSYDDHCHQCGTPLYNEKYFLPISVDETMILCYDCNLEENAGIMITEIEDDEEVLQVIRELQEQYDQEERDING